MLEFEILRWEGEFYSVDETIKAIGPDEAAQCTAKTRWPGDKFLVRYKPLGGVTPFKITKKGNLKRIRKP